MRRVFLYLLSSSTALFCTSKFLSRLTYPRGDRSCKYSMLLTSSLLLYRVKCTTTYLIWFYIINFPIRKLLMVVPFKNGQRKKESNFARLEKKHCPSCLLLYYIIIILLLQENCIHSKQSFEQDSSGAFWLRLEILGSTYYYKSPFVCQ